MAVLSANSVALSTSNLAPIAMNNRCRATNLIAWMRATEMRTLELATERNSIRTSAALNGCRIMYERHDRTRFANMLLASPAGAPQ